MNGSRRNFLRTAPAAAVAGLALNDVTAPAAETPEKFQVFTVAQLTEDQAALQVKPGNNNLVTLKQVAVVMTVETAKSAKEFEWHEGRDHIVQILDGTTVYELGGTPRGAHSSKAGEWNSPESVGASRLVLVKGDMITIPRGTPHKRSTSGSVTFLLISPNGVA